MKRISQPLPLVPLHLCSVKLHGEQWLWCCRDVSFYGNKLFQSAFIAIIAPGSSILTGLLWTLLNSIVALVCHMHALSLADRVAQTPADVCPTRVGAVGSGNGSWRCTAKSAAICMHVLQLMACCGRWVTIWRQSRLTDPACAPPEKAPSCKCEHTHGVVKASVLSPCSPRIRMPFCAAEPATAPAHANTAQPLRNTCLCHPRHGAGSYVKCLRSASAECHGCGAQGPHAHAGHGLCPSSGRLPCLRGGL